MSWPMVWYKDPIDGQVNRSYRNCDYDPVAGTFTFDDDIATRRALHEHPEMKNVPKIRLTITKDQVLWTNDEGRCCWKLTDVPCHCGGYGADVKAYSMAQELKKEIASGDPKPPRYVEWRSQFIEDFEKNGPKLEELKIAYPNIKEW